MSEREDFQVDLEAPRLDPYLLAGGRAGGGWRSRRAAAVVLTTLLLLGGGAALWWYLQRGRAAEREAGAAAAAEERAAPAPAPAQAVDTTLPALAGSDAWLRQAAAQLSRHPQLAVWLANDELVRGFVAMVENLAAGKSPATHVPYLRPTQPFTARESGGGAVVDEAAYARYDLLAAVVDSLDVGGTAELYRRMTPLLDEAYRELGFPEGRFEDPLRAAARRVLAVPVLEGPPQVVAGPLSYSYADPALESLDAASKHLLRLGPRNLTTLQAKVRAVASAAGLTLE